MKTSLLRRAERSTIAAAIAVLAVACGSSGDAGSGGGTGSSSGDPAPCLLAACAANEDCPMGAHCNTALAEPRCERLYCGVLGSACSEDPTCATGLACREGRCCAEHGQPCSADADCCAPGYGDPFGPQTCQMGVCANVCRTAGQGCAADADCCSGLSCDPDTHQCHGDVACTTCAAAFALGLTPPPEAPTCGPATDIAFAELHGCACNGPCAASCTTSCASTGHTDACDACLSTQCADQLAACNMN